MNDSDIIFFIDRSLGRTHVANALKSIGEKVEIHDEHFHQSERDVIWLPEVSRRGWIILTADKNIGRNQLEVQAVKSSFARVFTLISKNLSGSEMGDIFVQAIYSIKAIVKNSSAPFIARVYKDGSVKIWKDYKNS
ncbi:MAG: hypothetical protein SAK29_18920 [Scytonema sp. PMC 1069.18]|nr:hypothetical protein [Scytonema sp. PMC 1069.18]MEC4885957.1 hypothetical protein [Scytonema sp. PMC 1070.18]